MTGQVLEFNKQISNMTNKHSLNLNFDLKFEDLYVRSGLEQIDKLFVSDLKDANVELYNRFVSARVDHNNLAEKDLSNLLIDVAPYLEDFIARLFNIEKETKQLAAKHDELANIYTCKRLFVQRRAAKKYKEEEASNFDADAVIAEAEKVFGNGFSELEYADLVNKFLEDELKFEKELDVAAKYAAFALFSETGIHKHKQGVLFKIPKKLDFFNLVPVATEILGGVTVKKLHHEELRFRDGFNLTDKGGSLQQALDDANYCIYCHNQGKDSCSKGLKEKDNKTFKRTVHDVMQAGCPLEEKISEMNTLKARGVSLGALAIVTVDNPMCAATGHRICNDCMKGCIYQKQEPVNIPRTETRVLQDILDLPWGFEIYSLLTRWNPLNLVSPLPKAETGYKVLVAGLGPAGFTLSHYLLNEGHTVVAIDGLKIEPLPEELSGVKQDGSRTLFKPIYDIQSICEELGDRVLAGFGGVAEYGITVRWNKNYLKIIRLLLERRTNFAMFGGIRFGGTITYDSARKYGFDHIALTIGAGKPTVLDIPNALARGVRTASDFLMSLQLTGAAKKQSIANLQLRLPVVVIGGGLTAVDTATESLAYYPLQVEKFLSRYEILCNELGEARVRQSWGKEETIIADEFISHAKAFREERQLAEQQKREPDFISLINKFGGVKIAYRKTLAMSPAYRLNHEEVELAMQEGLEFIENAEPISVEVDDFNHADGLTVKIKECIDGIPSEVNKTLKAKSIFMAAGTNPNTTLQREDSEHFELDGKYFRAIDEDGNTVTPEANISKPDDVFVLMSKSPDNKYVSFFGDLHPSFVGNVVKAMGSAKQGYKIITNVLAKEKPLNPFNNEQFINFIADELIATIVDVVRLTPNIIEIVVKAKAQSREFGPGQFYRLQNFEANSFKVSDAQNNKTVLSMEGLALTGAWVDKEQGLISTIVLEMGGSSDLCTTLKHGEKIILMGPTGTPTEIVENETVMLVGGGLGNAVLFSIGKALKEAGSKVLYFAGYKKEQDRYKVSEIEKASDVIIWACDEAAFTPERPQDRSFHGNIIKAIEAYGSGLLGNQQIKLSDVSRIITIGSDRMMAAVAVARYNELKKFLNPNHLAIGSINSPMQCMMKEICAQCLQKHIDPKTGKEIYIYSCFNQDQHLDEVNFPHLNERLKQNTVQEKLTVLWIDRCLKQLNLRKAA